MRIRISLMSMVPSFGGLLFHGAWGERGEGREGTQISCG